jgi:BirA family biotin operon repressor/biotin-[acetyl-CoA-carboxylase] ligase
VSVLESLGSRVPGVGLKWPNDIISDSGKLGGILIELVGEPSGPCSAVIGLGLNLRVPPEHRQNLGQAVADLHQFMGAEALQRNRLAAGFIHALLQVCASFPSTGVEPYLERWPNYDLLMNRNVTLHLPSGVTEGIVRGVDSRGALRLETPDGVSSYFSGDVQLKLRHDLAD